jgi:uncharacterized protein
VTVPVALLLVLAGVGAGLVGSIAGLASLVSYPALLASGLAPVPANVTNTVALVWSGVGSTLAARPELVGQRARAKRLAGAGVAGGLVGAVLLLVTPSDAFARIVPWLIAFASLAILVPSRPRRGGQPHPAAAPRALTVAVFAVSVYGGYFGAAAGVVLLSLLLLVTGDTLPRSNAVKNLVLCAANLVAATLFAVFAHVDWAAAVPLAIGFLLGGALGPGFVRRAPAAALRLVIALGGLVLAIRLGLQAYG